MFIKNLRYLKFLLKSRNQHGVHSPFIYDLITKCLYKKTNKKYLNYYKETKKKNEDGFINNEITTKKAEILILLSQYFKPKNILEIGKSLGFAKLAMKVGFNNSKIISIDNCQGNINISDSLFLKNRFKNIDKHFDIILFSNNEPKKTLPLFENCLCKINNDSLFIFNEIYNSKEMIDSWTKIKQDSRVSVTVDLFYFGLVFFRKEQKKEDFKIRVKTL